jgi:Flp pilus assembly protein TadB
MIQVGSGVIVGLIGYLRWGLLFALLFFVGYLIPGFYVKYRVGQRLKKFNGQLGDTLTLLSNALKAGYSFAQAIDTVAKNAVAPIGDEFARAVRGMRPSPISPSASLRQTSTWSRPPTRSTARSVETSPRSSTTSRTPSASGCGSRARSRP